LYLIFVEVGECCFAGLLFKVPNPDGHIGRSRS
jgi:hypothetical protein